MRLSFLAIVFILEFDAIRSQNVEVGAEYGRAYFLYKHKDYGNGLVKAPASNYNFIAGLSISKRFGNKFFWQTGLIFTLFQQYYSTRLYWGAFEEEYPVILIPIKIGIETKRRLSINSLAGISLGIMPHQYEGTYGTILVYPFVDSITRGTVKRSFTPVFPMVSIQVGLNYALTPLWHVLIKVGFSKGFVKITEYDIFYNNGSGSNDQRARQWGVGDFYDFTIGISRKLKAKN